MIPALEKQRQKESEFEAILGYIAGSHLKKGGRGMVLRKTAQSAKCVSYKQENLSWISLHKKLHRMVQTYNTGLER